ncbi:MAG: glycerophosphodiester phosphodiesterase [Rubrivivax sp.]
MLALAAVAASAFDLQGHRGARGLLPENTIAAFQRALQEGADTLELDVMLTADGVPVVSHDPALNPDLTRDAAGRWLDGPGPLIRSLTLAQLQAYDVGRARPGSRTARDFPLQQPADGQRIPTLAQVLALGGPRTRFNIEIKLDPRMPEQFAPLEQVVDAVVRAVEQAGVGPRVLIQSFNWNVLQRSQRVAPQLVTSYLTMQRPNANTVDAPAWMAGFSLAAQGSVPRMVQAAGGRWWAPNFRDVTAESVREARSLGLKVAVWTVNEPADMQRMLDLGVDALITDYPDRAAALRR